MSKKPKTPEPVAQDLSALTAGMMATNPAAAKAWMDIMSEGARFVSARLQEDLETQMAVLNCKSPAEVVQVQSQFFQKAFEQYTAETMRMFKIMSGATEDVMKGAKSSHKRGYDDVPV